jgi:hypothetical protein
MTMTNLSLDPLTWIIYQGHLSTRCPPSPTHASTNHVSKSPIYHHNICVCTIPCTMHINTYTIPCANHAHQQHLYHTMFQPCTSTCTTICTITSVYLNNVSISMVDLEHNNQLPNKIIHISRASRILQGLTSISKITFQGLTSMTTNYPNQFSNTPIGKPVMCWVTVLVHFTLQIGLLFVHFKISFSIPFLYSYVFKLKCQYKL